MFDKVPKKYAVRVVSQKSKICSANKYKLFKIHKNAAGVWNIGYIYDSNSTDLQLELVAFFFVIRCFARTSSARWSFRTLSTCRRISTWSWPIRGVRTGSAAYKYLSGWRKYLKLVTGKTDATQTRDDTWNLILYALFEFGRYLASYHFMICFG